MRHKNTQAIGYCPFDFSQSFAFPGGRIPTLGQLVVEARVRRPRTFHPILTIFIAIIGLPSLCVLSYYLALHACPVPRAKLQQLQDGMTTNEVTLLLGNPSVILDPKGWPHWQYQRFYCLQSIEVVFGPEGRFMNWHWE